MPFISEVPSIFIQRFYTGWITLRNQLVTPIKVMGRRIIQLYDALIGGNDMEITPLLTLKRRAGHTAYVTLNAPAMFLYSWKSNTQGTIPIIDCTTEIDFVNSGGTVTSITSKGSGTGKNLESSILGIGNYLYVGTTQNTFKWDGPSGSQGKSNWGISISAFGSSTLKTAGSGANGSGLGTNWTNPGDVTGAVGFATTTATPSVSGSNFLLCETFGYAVSGTIIGIQVNFTSNISWSSIFGGATSSLIFTILKNGSPVGIGKPVNNGSIGVNTIGGSSDLWGATFTASDINQTTFGVQIQAAVGGNLGHIPTFSPQIQNVQITVFSLGGPVPTPTGSGTFAAVNGFSYVVAYGNATSGEVSNASVISGNTGPFSAKLNVSIPVTASTDPQVNQIRVYRTTDSGGGSQFFEISNSPFPNTTTTITDTTLDTALQVSSQAEINLGNTPPPAGLTNLEWFAGRMWGSVGNVLFASTGPETISGTAPNSNWNPQFQFLIPQPIIRNVRGPNGMIVFTVDDSYIVRGTDIVNYTVNEFVKDFGIRTYNAVSTDGTNMFVFTSDRQFIQMTASGANDIGLPIADQLARVDPSFVYVTVNRFGLDSIVRILDTVNNITYDYNLNQQCWHLPGILQMAGCSAMGSIETAPGVWRLMLSTTNVGTSQLAFRDINNFQDLGTSYAPNAVIGSVQLADPGTLAKFGARGGIALEMENAGTAPTLSVLANDKGCTPANAVGSQITGTFINLPASVTIPPTLGAQPVNYRSLLFFWSSGQSLSGLVRHFQVKLSFLAENFGNEIIGFGTVPDEKSESEASAALPPIQGR